MYEEVSKGLPLKKECKSKPTTILTQPLSTTKPSSKKQILAHIRPSSSRSRRFRSPRIRHLHPARCPGPHLPCNRLKPSSSSRPFHSNPFLLNFALPKTSPRRNRRPHRIAPLLADPNPNPRQRLLPSHRPPPPLASLQTPPRTPSPHSGAPSIQHRNARTRPLSPQSQIGHDPSRHHPPGPCHRERHAERVRPRDRRHPRPRGLRGCGVQQQLRI